MSSLFGGSPSPPKIPVVEPPPKTDDAAVQQAAADAAANRRRARGFRSTLLSQTMQAGSPGAPALKSTFGA
jgi:hypothetical protein